MSSFPLGNWSGIIGHISSVMDLEASVRSHQALLRRRGVRSSADRLHLALLYGPGGMSLQSLASHATETGIAKICDVSLLERLCKATDFLADLLQNLLPSGWALRHKAVTCGLPS